MTLTNPTASSATSSAAKSATDSASHTPDTPLLEVFAGLLADGLSLLHACRGHTRDELIHLGIPDTTARDLAKLADTYFGQTAYTRLRDQTLTAIAENQHSLVTLLAVEKLTNQLKHSRDKWKLRHHATNHPGPTSAVCTAARAYCRGLKDPPQPPQPGLDIIRRKSGDTWTLKLHATSDQVAEMAQHITTPEDLIGLIRHHEHTTATATTNPTDAHTASNKPHAAGANSSGDNQQYSTNSSPAATHPDNGHTAGDYPAPEVMTQHVICTDCGATTEATQVVAGLRTNVIITLDQFTDILNDNGDDVLLKMTNGATITGTELVTRMLADIGLVTLVHPVEGPINLYRLSRFANDKQRLMAMAENPTCPWDGCHHPADTAQIHHLKAWKNGGNTNPKNLTVACPYHNGINDDDPSKPRRGRLERVNGKVRRIPPWATTYHTTTNQPT